MGCRGFLQCMLKLTNFILATVGVAMIAYSIWMLNEWNQHNGTVSDSPSPFSHHPSSSSFKSIAGSSSVSPSLLTDVVKLPSSSSSSSSFSSSSSSSSLSSDSYSQAEDEVENGNHRKLDDNHDDHNAENQARSGKPTRVTLADTPTSPKRLSVGVDLDFDGLMKLPAPWFIYAFLIAGVFTVIVTCAGLVAAETSNGCCLSCYSLGLAVLLMAQATLSAVIFLDDTWEEDFPADPTGEEAKARSFVVKHLVICQWAAIAVLAVEIVGLLLSLTMKAMQDGGRRRGGGGGYDSDEEFAAVSRASSMRESLLSRVQVGNLPPPPLVAEQMAGTGPANQGYRGLPRGQYGMERANRGVM